MGRSSFEEDMKFIALLLLFSRFSEARLPHLRHINRRPGGAIVQITIKERPFDLTLDGATSPPIPSDDAE